MLVACGGACVLSACGLSSPTCAVVQHMSKDSQTLAVGGGDGCAGGMPLFWDRACPPSDSG